MLIQKLHVNVYSNITHAFQNMKTNNMFFNRWMENDDTFR